jgi:hypothetical protein
MSGGVGHAAATADLPPTERAYVKIVAYFVAAIVGLGPILGTEHVPGFTAIAAVFPQNMQRGLVPFASLLMGVAMLAARFFAADHTGTPLLNRLFFIVLPVVIVLTLLVYFFYSSYVEQVEFEGGRSSAAYIVGDQMLPTCPCAEKHLEIAACVGPVLSADPALVSGCYPRRDISQRQSILAITYLLLMTSFGMLVALIVKKESRRARTRRAAAAVAE